MNHRDKVLAAIAHQNHGRIPFCVAPCKSLAVHGQALLELLQEYGNDFFDPCELKVPQAMDPQKTASTTDMWGCVWDSLNPLFAGAVSYSPLADWDRFNSYRMPAVVRTTAEDLEKAQKTRQEYPVWASLEQFFQVMQNIRGSENLFMDFYTQPEEVQKLIDRMLREYHLPQLEEKLKLKPDILGTGDDWGTQTALLINPDLWRQFFKPVYQAFTDMCHQAGAKIWFHTCGYTQAILEELIAIGIDVVNPQMAIMDARQYGNIARDKITIVPDLDRQGILVSGTPGDVQRHILDIYPQLGTASGGLIGYCPIEPGMPLANIESMLRTVSDFTPMTEHQ